MSFDTGLRGDNVENCLKAFKLVHYHDYGNDIEPLSHPELSHMGLEFLSEGKVNHGRGQLSFPLPLIISSHIRSARAQGRDQNPRSIVHFA